MQIKKLKLGLFPTSVKNILILSVALFSIQCSTAQSNEETSKETEKTIEVGDHLPSFTLKDQNNKVFSIDSVIGTQNLVIYFYPKDDTPGCTKEACTFRDKFDVFKDANALVIGISADSPASHKAFAKKYDLPFILLSDEEDKVRALFGVPGSLMGIIPGRVTYIADKEGIVQKVYNSQTNAEQHAQEAIDILKTM
ncbi:MAG: peroxiredoxin [Crocinitomicaceae bacterium]|nr:peroxiredoxin [Crocinitomicaceae bacterium]MAX82435.1 peroxiredoxin [Crocinitomicaceae bacterium]|tara:strand:- start:194 stop:781 length:588 start_codon:yes stop_codon:yes gene_type:complete